MPLLNVIQSSKSIYDKITAKEEGEAEKNGRENPFSFKHDITVKNLTFSYEGKNVFKYLNFTLEKGKKYLLKGPSGVGKTTLIKLLSMSYDDYEGSITIDGKDLQTIRLDDFNKNVSFIYQDVFLFEASIFENISLFKDIDPKRVMDSAISAGLEDFLKQEPDSINTRISENGKNLSGGERQRISIARALCKEAEILFVDEATASLNDDLGRSIEQTILNLDATVVAISHKFFQGITSQYDYVLELKDGYINQYAASDYFSEDGQNEKENNVL